MFAFRKSIAFRIFFTCFILLSLPPLIGVLLILENFLATTESNTKHRLVLASDWHLSFISRTLQTKHVAIYFAEYMLKKEKVFSSHNRATLSKKLQEIAKVGDFPEIIFLKKNEKGEVEVEGASFEDNDTNEMTTYSFYKKIVQENLGDKEINILYAPPFSSHYLIFGTTLLEDDGTPLGTLLFTTDVGKRLGKFLIPRELGATFHFAILDEKNIIVAAYDPALVFQYLCPLSADEMLNIKEKFHYAKKNLPNSPLKVRTFEGNSVEFEWNNQTQMGILTPIARTHFSLLAYAGKKDLYLKDLFYLLGILGFLLLILVVGCIITYLLTRRIVRPFKALSNVMEGIQKGDLTLRYKKDPLGFEINDLGASFNLMVETLIEKKHVAEEESIKNAVYEKELYLGREIQRRLLPKEMPKIEGLEIEGRYVPATQVGGDFLDAFEKEGSDGNEIVLLIADAAGKGVSACLYSLAVRSAFRIYLAEEKELTNVIRRTNHVLSKAVGASGAFVTVFIAIFNRKTNMLTYVNMGHNPSLIRRKEGGVEALNERDVALGFDYDAKFRQFTVKLEKGDLLLLYTDGITEATNSNNELFSDEKLHDMLKKRGGEKASDFVDELLREVKTFEGEAPQHDDITLLAMKLYD